MPNALDSFNSGSSDNNVLFANIAQDILEQGYSINPIAMPNLLCESLCEHLQQMKNHQFEQAGVGRRRDHVHNTFVRRDEICWITGDSPAGQDWLAWASKLQSYLNRKLFLGLFSFESHFAHYEPGAFYKRHLDSFKGAANRVLSLIVYLNHNWIAQNGGELVIYRNHDDLEGIKVTPTFATVVVFLSEDFPHEVLPAQRDRYSIAGWYRVNSSREGRADPPR